MDLISFLIQAPGVSVGIRKRLIKLALDISVKDSALVQVVHALQNLKNSKFFLVRLVSSSMIDACDKESLLRLYKGTISKGILKVGV